MKSQNSFLLSTIAFTGLGTLSVFLVSGCSNQDMGMSMGGVSRVIDSGKPYIQSTTEQDEALRQRQFDSALTTWKAQQPDQSDEYTIGPDDILKISIDDLEKPDQTAEILRTVPDNGILEMPLIGNVTIKDFTCKQIVTTLKNAYKDDYIKDPQIAVEVSEHHSRPVIITGAVTKPGIYYLKQNSSTVLEALFLAGGIPANAGKDLTIVRDSPEDKKNESSKTNVTQPKMITIDLKDLIDRGQMSHNLPIFANDVIAVRPKVQKFAYVLGFVNRPGAIEIPSDQDEVSALELLAQAGGVTAIARAQNAFILTERNDERKVVSVDLTKIANGVRPPVYMKAGDTLFVGSSVIAKLSEFVRPTVGVSASAASGL